MYFILIVDLNISRESFVLCIAQSVENTAVHHNLLKVENNEMVVQISCNYSKI
jgi:hypothetical protein